MLREIEEIYIDNYSAWEKHRKTLGISALVGVIFSGIVMLFNLFWGYIMFFVTIFALIVVGVYARRSDYRTIKKKQDKNINKFKYKNYKILKFEELKNKLMIFLKSQNMCNKESLEILINTYLREIHKYDKISIISLIATIIIALLGLSSKQLAIAIVVLFGLGIALFIPIALEMTLKYILVNKVKYEVLIDALTEIQLETINKPIKNNKEQTWKQIKKK